MSKKQRWDWASDDGDWWETAQETRFPWQFEGWGSLRHMLEELGKTGLVYDNAQNVHEAWVDGVCVCISSDIFEVQKQLRRHRGY